MAKEDLIKFSKMVNICDDLDDDVLGQIASKVSEGYQRDLTSMALWLMDVDASIKLTSMKREGKDTPFPNAANIKYPLITNACYQFAANTYPEIVKDGKVVKAAVLGTDFEDTKVERGNRISDFMNYQLLFQSTEWEEGLDNLLVMLPIIGLIFKKTYFDSNRKMMCSEVCNYKEIVLDSGCKSLKSIRRISHVLKVSLNDLVENARTGIYNENAVSQIVEKYKNMEVYDAIELIEQHRYLDLDDDGYEEPYVVTVEKETRNVLRIYARYEKEGIKENKKGVYLIEPIEYFTDFHFLPNPDGSFLSVGFGTLMLHLNMSINTILNQLIDAGTLRNMQGGYIDSRLKINTGSSRHHPGEWLKATPAMGQDLASGFYPVNYQEPSNVLLQLLGMLIQAGKELSSSTDVMNGGVLPDNSKTGAVGAIIERGLKIFNSIQRRFYRSEKNELQKIFDLNSRFLDEKTYFTVLDDEKAVLKSDFNREDIDVMPIADPNMSSDTQRLNQIQILQTLKGQPGVDNREIDMRTLHYARIQDPEKILPPPNPNPEPPPEIIELQAKLTDMAAAGARKDRELALRDREIQIEEAKLPLELAKIESETMKNLAQAEAADQSTNLKDLQLQVGMINKQIDTTMAQKKMAQEREMAMMQQQAAQGQQPPGEQPPEGAINAEQPPTPPPMAGPPDDAGASPSDAGPSY